MNLARQLRNDLIHRIEQIDDVNFLKAIQSVLDHSDEGVFELNEQQQASISISREELKNGKGLDHNAVIGELRTWLREK